VENALYADRQDRGNREMLGPRGDCTLPCQLLRQFSAGRRVRGPDDSGHSVGRVLQVLGWTHDCEEDYSCTQKAIYRFLCPCQKYGFMQKLLEALAENLLSLGPLIGGASTSEHVVPMFLTLLKDDNSDVRLPLLRNLEDLNRVCI